MRAQEFINEISDEQLQRYLDRAGRQVDARQERMARVRDRLNKGYEIYHAEEPTKIVDRFEARTPQEAKRYYDDFITKKKKSFVATIFLKLFNLEYQR